MLRRALLLLAAIGALGALLSLPPIASGTGSGEAKSRVGVFDADLDDRVGGRSSESAGKALGWEAESAEIASGYLVAGEGAYETGDAAIQALENPGETIEALAGAALDPIGTAEATWGECKKVGAAQCGSGVLTGVVTGGAGNFGKAASISKAARRKSSSCFGNSFVAGTPVLLADGRLRPIELISKGDRVLAMDPETGELVKRQVTDFIDAHAGREMVALLVGAATIRVTADHPFWSVDKGAWVEADELREGEQLLSPAGGVERLAGVRDLGVEATVYNLTVRGAHTYFVAAGAARVLVHNCGAAGEGATRTGRGKNKLNYDERALGDHTTFKWGPDGRVKKYQDWHKNERNPNGFDPGRRFDGMGGPHGGVETPHMHPRGSGTATPRDGIDPWDLPNGY